MLGGPIRHKGAVVRIATPHGIYFFQFILFKYILINNKVEITTKPSNWVTFCETQPYKSK
jgi:hypothetical protein